LRSWWKPSSACSIVGTRRLTALLEIVSKLVYARRMRTIVLLAVLLAGCAGPPHVVAENPAAVIVGSAKDAAASLGLADAQCQKHGKRARYAGRVPGPGIQISYDCVP
jgi:hypothetical protein